MQEKIEKPGNEKEKELVEKEKFDNLKGRLLNLLDKDWQKTNSEMIKFSRYLKNKYDDYEEYALYYVLNSPDYKKCKYFEFPDDEHSIEKFIKRLEEEQKEPEDGGEDEK
ncbi:MAG: hypothetical protein PHZ04_01060 [Patescibacteria group bacterium]|nr:hypothetical protein [Patescibacteria group bacterium]MDD5295024.1 hypothetical protein [Patescibacteria group bacterium]MDD5554429.1 hypothetical protein [Patescibacteria group bacterium]